MPIEAKPATRIVVEGIAKSFASERGALDQDLSNPE